ncbi:MAG: methyltransferase [Brumimicrobium sp.]|nr:methyltransferase [Brumimicrobium sp.]
MSRLNAVFWDERYKNNQTGWDLGEVSPPLGDYFDTLWDKSLSILIPGAGNAYEADYLLKKGFNNITVIDISSEVVSGLKKKWEGKKEIQVLRGDFFDLQGKFDLIVEQTFFCALDPDLRNQYVNKVYELLKPDGRLVGVLFDKEFEDGPPFGGSKDEYKDLFRDRLKICKMETCYNSIKPREGSELWIDLEKEG